MSYKVTVDGKRVASGLTRNEAIEVSSLVEGSRVWNEETGDEVVNSCFGVIREIADGLKP